MPTRDELREAAKVHTRLAGIERWRERKLVALQEKYEHKRAAYIESLPAHVREVALGEES